MPRDRLTFSMERFFPRVDAYGHRQQVQLVAAELQKNPPPRAASTHPPRPVGRPPKKRDANELVAAAAAAAAPAAPTQLPANKRMRGPYIRWFSSPYINDILAAHARTGYAARRTVALLRKEAPDDRFERLSHTTVASWFDDKHTLTHKHQLELAEGAACPNGMGPCPALLAAPGAEQQIVDALLQMREAGTPLNSRIIRWVMQAVLQEKHPAVLQQLELSQTFISRWVRSNKQLRFRWRARTTAASKLPADWQEQGIDMAMRLAATMHLHKVSNQQHAASSRAGGLQLLVLTASPVATAVVLRCIPLSSSTWIRLESIWCLLHHGPTRSWAAAASPSWVQRTRDKSLPALLRRFEEICCPCS